MEAGCDVYSERVHNLCCDNCHSHVAHCLNGMGYDRITNWEMVRIGVWIFFCGRFVSVGAAVKTYLPFTIILLVILFGTGTIVPF